MWSHLRRDNTQATNTARPNPKVCLCILCYVVVFGTMGRCTPRVFFVAMDYGVMLTFALPTVTPNDFLLSGAEGAQEDTATVRLDHAAVWRLGRRPLSPAYNYMALCGIVWSYVVSCLCLTCLTENVPLCANHPPRLKGVPSLSSISVIATLIA
jgi:hypothetical protein